MEMATCMMKRFDCVQDHCRVIRLASTPSNPVTTPLEQPMKLTLSRAEELLATTTHDPHLLLHATNVRGCMEAFARHFGQLPEEVEHWGAVG